MLLTLRLRPERPGGLFEFGEPVHVELEATPIGHIGGEITQRLSPTTQGVEIHYETPCGRFKTYKSPFTLCVLPSSKVLGPEQPAIYKDVCVSHTLNDFHFIEPGRYRIRAAYRYNETTLVSNVLTVFVRTPAVRQKIA